MQPLLYTGTKLAQKPIRIEHPDHQVETIDPYIPSSDLVKAVNLALFLQRPLLVMGEPGCGKSKLAQAIAYELYHEKKDKNGKTLNYRDYYQEWFIKSTAKAQDGLYEYDAIRRLADAQIARTKAGRNEMNKRRYWKLKQMGEAFRRSTATDQRVVLLIDEIDKADLDFPNDLLNELDNAWFTISETGEKVVAKEKPIVIITSNAEKDLPDAFLRRCLYHHIRFDADKLSQIVVSRFHTNDQQEALDPATKDFIETAKTAFLAIRKRIETEKMIVGGKTVSTSEFLDWYKALDHYRTTAKETLLNADDQRAIDQLTAELTMLDTPGKYPFAQVLFKNYSTWLNFTPQAKS